MRFRTSILEFLAVFCKGMQCTADTIRAKSAGLVYDGFVSFGLLPEQEGFMEINSTSSASSGIYAALNANAQASQARARQPEQDPQQNVQAQAPQARPQAANEAQPSQAATEMEMAARARSTAESNRPVVNTSGQLVGTRVNTTA